MVLLKNVSKKFDSTLIFENVNLTLREGTVTAFVGHNGCGKSTLLKVISGLISKNGGEIIEENNYRYSYVPEKFPSISMSARTYLTHMAQIDGLYSKKESSERINALAKEFFLEEMLDKSMKELSKGTLQKIGVIQALLREPDVLLLDEPLSGQDVDSQKVFIAKINELKQKGCIILLSAHEMNLIHSLGDFIYTLENKKLIPYKNSQNSTDATDTTNQLHPNNFTTSTSINHSTLYKLRRYFFSSKTVIPIVGVLCFIRATYSVQPMNICSGFILSGVFYFCLMVFVTMSINGSEEDVEEQLLFLRNRTNLKYYLSRELNLICITLLYGFLLTIGPVIVNWCNHYQFFLRPLQLNDVLLGGFIILGSGFSGITVGDFLHPKVLKNRKLSIILTLALLVLTIVKDAMIKEWKFLCFLNILLPPVMKPAKDHGASEFFSSPAVLLFLAFCFVYYTVFTIIKIFILKKKRF